MATTFGHPTSGLKELLHREGGRFAFFQAVRLLERMHPERALVGGVAAPQYESVRFRSHLSLAFPASEIVQPRTADPERDEWRSSYVILPARGSLKPRPGEADPQPAPSANTGQEESEPSEKEEEVRPAQMTVAFLGLTGPQSALPYHYTELLIERVLRHRDHTLRDFLDIFNHRLVSLFYRAWAKHRPILSFERSATPRADQDAFGAADEWAWFLLSLIGFGTEGLAEQLSFPARGLLAYAELFAHRPRSATALERILRDALAEPRLRVIEFVGQEYGLPPESQFCLGEHGCELGCDVVLGDRVHLQDAKFRIQVGPLPLHRYRRFLPTGADPREDGELFRRLVELTRLFVGPTLDFDVELLHEEIEKVGICLGDTGLLAPRLGMTTWLLHSSKAQEKRASLFPAST